MKRLVLSVGMLLLLGWWPANAAGFQWATAPDPDDAPLQVAIWYRALTRPWIPMWGRSR